MISHRNRFVFVHIPKTAGQSLRKALRPHVYSPVQWAAHYVGMRTGFPDLFGVDAGGAHGTAAERRAAMGDELFDSYYSFAVVRNPWDRMVSFYHFTRLRPETRNHEVATSRDFAGYVAFLHEGARRHPRRQQADFILDRDGRALVSRVARFETLAQDFAEICAHLGLSAELPHKNSSRHGAYLREYTGETREMVAEICARDIATFGYVFDGSEARAGAA